MNVTFKVASILALMATACAAWPQTEPLGRLFFTPTQRAELDRIRRSGQIENALDDSGSLTVSGRVVRRDGKQTTWINGRPVSDTELPTGAESVRRLKVGESIHPSSGEREDLLKGGSITIRPSPRP